MSRLDFEGAYAMSLSETSGLRLRRILRSSYGWLIRSPNVVMTVALLFVLTSSAGLYSTGPMSLVASAAGLFIIGFWVSVARAAALDLPELPRPSAVVQHFRRCIGYLLIAYAVGLPALAVLAITDMVGDSLGRPRGLLDLIYGGYGPLTLGLGLAIIDVAFVSKYAVCDKLAGAMRFITLLKRFFHAWKIALPVLIGLLILRSMQLLADTVLSIPLPDEEQSAILGFGLRSLSDMNMPWWVVAAGVAISGIANAVLFLFSASLLGRYAAAVHEDQ